MTGVSKILTLCLCLLCPNVGLAAADCVVLLHGLARTKHSMDKLQEQLQQAGYQTVNLGYPSREFSVELLAVKAIAPALATCKAEADIHFVTHSLGGILVRQYLRQQPIPGLKRVVMLGPPNQGSEVVDELAHWPGFHWLNGDAGMQLGTDTDSLPIRLGPANFEVGIIAGTRSINLLLSLIIPGDDDGKVAVDRTRLEGMNDHLTLPVTHPLMMRDKQVIEQVIHYLQHGRFSRPDDKFQPG